MIPTGVSRSSATTTTSGLFLVAAWDFGLGIGNQHVVYAVVTAALGYVPAGEAYGSDAIIERTSFAKRTPALRYVLG